MKKASCFVAAVSLLAFSGSAYASHSHGQCNNCHVPHNAVLPGSTQDTSTGGGTYGVPLWSPWQLHTLPTYTLYSGKRFDLLTKSTANQIGQPDGPSKLCLSCHDGSYAGHTFPTTRAWPTSLAMNHPISFVYDAALSARSSYGGIITLNDPTTTISGLGNNIDTDLLDSQHKMQCISCHDPHTSGDWGGACPYMLRPVPAWKTMTFLSSGTNSKGNPIYTGQLKGDPAMCTTCHNK